jgi:chaperonin GroES
MNIQPIGERVLIKVKQQEERTKGGLYIPESAKDSKKEGEVIAVGKMKEGNMPVKVGDTILYGGYSSEEFEIDNENYVILDVKDILAVTK